ncbi:MAG: hypothetical protein WD826_09975, partial [Actinomycetota bacterium]
MMLGAPVTARPQRVIEDSGDLLVTYWPIGTLWWHPNFANRETAPQEIEDGTVKWEITPWTTHEVLELVRLGLSAHVEGGHSSKFEHKAE